MKKSIQMMSNKMMILLKGNACTKKFGSYEYENQICEYGLLAFASDFHFEKTVLSFWNVKDLWFCNLHEHLEEMLCENRNYVYSNFISRPLWTKLSTKCNHTTLNSADLLLVDFSWIWLLFHDIWTVFRGFLLHSIAYNPVYQAQIKSNLTIHSSLLMYMVYMV